MLLEHIRTPDAIAILKDMATGHPDAAPTKLAKDALKRTAAGKIEMEACWADLEKSEAPASRALLDLYDHAKEVVPFLAEKMRPLAISSGQVKALLLKLNNANEQVWKPAFLELEYFDPRLAIGLEELMDRVTESPGRQRMVAILSERDPASLVGTEIKLWRVAGSSISTPTAARGGPNRRCRRSTRNDGG